MAPQGPQYTNVQEQFQNSGSKVGWPKRFFTFALVLFVTVFLVYLGLAFGYESFLQNAIGEIETELDTLSDQVTDEQREQLATLYSQVTNIRGLLSDHTVASQAFNVLQSITSDQVVYTDFDLSTPEREASIEGVAASYEALVSQLALYEDSDAIERFTLKNSEVQNNIVTFGVTVVFQPDVFSLE